MNSKPKISIIVTSYNQERFLNSTLNSVYKQTWKAWECLIVDDGSRDNSRLIAEKWEERDSRFRLILKEHGGVSSTRNLGLVHAKGEYIQFLDGDDFLDQNKLEKSLNYVSINISHDIIITNFRLFSDRDKEFLPPYCELTDKNLNFENILYKWDENFSVPIHSGLIHKKLFENFTFPEDLKSKEDWFMWIMLFRNRPNLIFIDEALAFYRIHTESITNTSNMQEDHFRSLKYLKEVLSPDEYEQLLLVFIKRYYDRSIFFKDQLLKIKTWSSYKIENIIRKMFKKFSGVR